MGPSGSGKTSLLTALAGRVPAGSKMSLTGSLLVNGMPADEAGHRQVCMCVAGVRVGARGRGVSAPCYIVPQWWRQVGGLRAEGLPEGQRARGAMAMPGPPLYVWVRSGGASRTASPAHAPHMHMLPHRRLCSRRICSIPCSASRR